MKRLVSILLCTLLFGPALNAQVNKQFIEDNSLSGSSLVTTASTVIDLVDSPTIDPLRKRVEQARAEVIWTIDDIFHLGGQTASSVLEPFTIEFTFETFTGLNATGTNISTSVQTLEISSENSKGVKLFDLTDALINDNIQSIRLTVGTFGAPTINTAIPAAEIPQIENYISQKQQLLLHYYCDYGIDVRTDMGGLTLATAPTVQSLGTTPLTSRIQNFQWTSSYAFQNYELQILKLENIDPTNTSEESVKAKVDWDDALKIETTKDLENVRVTIAEGTGFYIWRVRPIGNYFNGGFGDARNWGQWSDNAFWNGLPGNEIELNTSVASLSSNPYAFFLYDPDDDKNWQYSRVIIEENKTGEGMVYANNLLQTVQSQGYSSTTGKSMISQTVMDYLGRPSLSTMAVPITNNGLDGYEDQFFLNSSGDLYTAADFDDDTNIDSPDQVTSGTSAFSYYSSDNPDQAVPDATGYPYSRTLFLPDGSGRAVEASGVGSVHAIGTDRTNKMLYATPSDDELIAIFGDEAPQAVNIMKTISIDPNGTATIAYTTIEGVTIATAMSSFTPDNLDAIDNPGDYGYLDMLVSHDVIVNTYSDQKFISSQVVGLEQSTEITLEYYPDCADDFGCAGGDCAFSVQFIISNIATGEAIYSDLIDLQGYGCATSIPSNLFSWNNPDAISGISYTENLVTLPVGNWKVQKVVSSGVNFAMINDVSESQEFLGPLVDLVADWMYDATDETALQEFSDNLDELITRIDLGHVAASGATYGTPAYQTAFLGATYDPGTGSTTNLVYFTDLETNFNFPLSTYEFNPEYTVEYGLTDPQNPSSPVDEGQLVFAASCCENLGVELPTQEAYPICSVIDPLVANGTLTQADVQFSEIFRVLYEEIIAEPSLAEGTNPDFTYEEDWPSTSPGYGITSTTGALPFTTDIDEMVYHMLSDQYFTGNAVPNGSGWDWETPSNGLRPIYDNPTANPPVISQYATEEAFGPYYTCDALYECWYASVRAYYELRKSNGSSYDVYGDSNEDQEENGDAAPGSDSAGTHFDDSESAEGDPSILDQLVSLIISIKMKDFSEDLAGTGTGNSGASQMALQFNLPSTFLECTGYKFAAIIDLPEAKVPYGIGEPNDPVLINDASSYIADKTPVYATEFDNNGTPGDASDDTMVEITPRELMYKNIKSPIWAFKYFEYDPALRVPTTSSPIDDEFINDNTYGMPNFEDPPYPGIASVASLELSNCYHDFSTLTVPFCNANYCVDGGHYKWNADQRYSFYKQIENSTEMPIGSCAEVSMNTGLEPYTCEELYVMIDEIFDEAKQSCTDRADYFRAQIEMLLIQNCYEIVPCVDGSSPSNYVSEAAIDAMVAEAVASCGAYVDELKEECIDLENTDCDGDPLSYPWSIVNTCNIISGNVICPTNERITVLFDPALHIEEKLARVKFGTFLPYGAPGDPNGVVSQCPGGSTNTITNDPEDCDELNESQSPELTTSN